MARPVAVLYVAALHVVLFCSGSFAATPLVIAELDMQRTIAAADLARTTAEQELAAWKLAQLTKLRSYGHASWQEVAQQEVTVKSATARAQASERYLQAVLEWQTRLSKLNLRPHGAESECVKLYMPHSARLVAWMSTDDASLDLSRRHLENLRSEYQSLRSIDLSTLETALENARRELDVHGRLEKDADLRSRAEIRCRLTQAQYDCGRTRHDGASLIARRMALVNESLLEKQAKGEESSPAVAQVGTRLVDATSDRELSRLVEAMAADDSVTSEQIAWLEHRRQAVLGRIDALQKLSKYSAADRGELEQTYQQETDLQLQIQQAQDAWKVQQQIADKYKKMLKSGPASSIKRAQPLALDDAWLADANVVRHLLQLQQLKLETAAGRAAIDAQRDYLVQRMKRVEQIPEQARRPKELDQMRHRIQGAGQQLAIVDRELVLLDQEQQRFRQQLHSQRGNQYQLVQAGKGALIRREQFELAEVLIATIGFVGHSDLFPKMLTPYPYIESIVVLDCMSTLSIQPRCGTPEFLCDARRRSGYPFLRPGAQPSAWNTPRCLSRLRLATDGITYPADLFCYVPYGWRPMHPNDRWAQRNDRRWLGICGFRTFHPYDSYPFGPCGLSIFSYRVGSPTRSSFPYRSSYHFRTAFPTTSILAGSPYWRPTSAYRGFRHSAFNHSWRLGDSCFD